MKQIEAFDILTISIQKYLIIAQKTGSRLNNLQIIAPCNPLNLQSLISEFDQLPNDSPRCMHLFERTGSILNNWNAFIALKKSDESLFYRLDEDYRIWRKSAGIDPEKWSEGNDYLFCTWDDVANIINEVNGYLRRKIGIKKSTASTTAKSNNMTLEQIALIHYYNKQPISRDNGNKIAAEYGLKSGDKLYQWYLHWLNNTNRHAHEDMTNKVLRNKIKKFESIEPYIEDEKNKRALLDDIKILKCGLDPNIQK
jgi:hypothetical protein